MHLSTKVVKYMREKCLNLASLYIFKRRGFIALMLAYSLQYYTIAQQDNYYYYAKTRNYIN